MSDNRDNPRNDFSRETKRGNGDVWKGLDKDTQPARREVDKGEWTPDPRLRKD